VTRLTRGHEAGQFGSRRFAGGRVSVRSGSGVSPNPKLARRSLNSVRSTGTPDVSEGSASSFVSVAGGISGSGSLDIRSFRKKFGRESGSPAGASRMEPEIPKIVSRSPSPPGPTPSCLPVIHLRYGERARFGRRSGAERCCDPTSNTESPPQSARCQEPWHLSVQTVARLQRSSRVDPVLHNVKVLWCTLLSDSLNSARLLQPRAESWSAAP
jgi:hypothetical protein